MRCLCVCSVVVNVGVLTDGHDEEQRIPPPPPDPMVACGELRFRLHRSFQSIRRVKNNCGTPAICRGHVSLIYLCFSPCVRVRVMNRHTLPSASFDPPDIVGVFCVLSHVQVPIVRENGRSTTCVRYLAHREYTFRGMHVRFQAPVVHPRTNRFWTRVTRSPRDPKPPMS